MLDRYLCGNIKDMTFREIFESEGMKSFLTRDALDNRCKECKACTLCGGGCRRFRSLYFGEDNYCAYREFLYECYPKIKMLANELFGQK